MRIVTVVPSLARNTGGPAVTLVQGTRAMGDAVQRVIYATDAAQPAASRPFRRMGPHDLPEGADDIPIKIFPTRHPYRLGFSPGLWRALQRDIPHADLVTIHSVNLFPQYAAFAIAMREKVPYIVTPHGALDPWLSQNSPLLKRINNAVWQRRMLANAAAIHFTTDEESRLASDLTMRSPHFVVPNGIDLRRFDQTVPGRMFRDKYLRGFRGQIVLFLGRIAKKKGIDLLIRAFAAAADGHDALLVIAGPDDEGIGADLAEIRTAVGLQERVRFVGPVYGEDHLAALSAADIWALTSHTENFGNAVVEAMAAGCAVLVSTEVNLASQIRGAEAGVIVTLSIDEIANSLKRLIESSSTRAALGSRARTFARRFDWAAVAPELLSAYRKYAVDHFGSSDPS